MYMQGYEGWAEYRRLDFVCCFLALMGHWQVTATFPLACGTHLMSKHSTVELVVSYRCRCDKLFGNETLVGRQLRRITF